MIPTDSISLCVFVHDDLAFLRVMLFYEMKWADQVCILDLGSTDGTMEFCHAALRPQDVYCRRDHNTVPQQGFDEARNYVGRLATCEWIIYSDADRIFDWHQARVIKQTLSGRRERALSTETWNVPKLEPTGDVNLIERAVALGTFTQPIEQHRLICRRDAGVRYIGYMHEEMHGPDGKVCHPAELSGLRQFHFSFWKNDKLRQPRYAWMLRNAIENPKLQKGTNEWWYKTYWPQNEVELRRMAADYEKEGVGR